MKGGAGQYFTPRPLIQAIVDVIRPKPGETHHGPGLRHRRVSAAAHDYISNNYDSTGPEENILKIEALHGIESSTASPASAP